jgi:hypothetical protein
MVVIYSEGQYTAAGGASVQCVQSEICAVGFSVACVFQAFHNNENGNGNMGCLAFLSQ